MQAGFDQQAPKKAANLSINSDLLAKARNLKINLSATLEQALIVQVKNAQREQWKNENKDAIEVLNKLSEKNGLFSDSFREF
jgi:antitoxin CcdA